MHSRLLVTLTATAEAHSEQVRHDVFDWLREDTTFCGDGGFFHAPLCDWFVIGGRWSGLLAETVMSGAFKHAVYDRFPDFAGEWLTKSVIDRHAAELDALWHSLGGIGPNPYSRSTFENHCYPDDAMLLTQDLYSALLAEHECEEAVDCYVDLDAEPLDPDFIGRKWLVVVDYHS